MGIQPPRQNCQRHHGLRTQDCQEMGWFYWRIQELSTQEDGSSWGCLICRLVVSLFFLDPLHVTAWFAVLRLLGSNTTPFTTSTFPQHRVYRTVCFFNVSWDLSAYISTIFLLSRWPAYDLPSRSGKDKTQKEKIGVAIMMTMRTTDNNKKKK